MISDPFDPMGPPAWESLPPLPWWVSFITWLILLGIVVLALFFARRDGERSADKSPRVYRATLHQAVSLNEMRREPVEVHP